MLRISPRFSHRFRLAYKLARLSEPQPAADGLYYANSSLCSVVLLMLFHLSLIVSDPKVSFAFTNTCTFCRFSLISAFKFISFNETAMK